MLNFKIFWVKILNVEWKHEFWCGQSIGKKKKRSEKSIQNLLGNHIIIFVCKGRSRVKTSYMELEVKLF